MMYFSQDNTILHVACMRTSFSVARVIRDACKKVNIKLDSVPNKVSIKVDSAIFYVTYYFRKGSCQWSWKMVRNS